MKVLIALLLIAGSIAHKEILDRIHHHHHIEHLDEETVSHIQHKEDFDPEESYQRIMSSFQSLAKPILGCKKSDSHDFWQFSFETSGRVGHDNAVEISLTEREDDCYESMKVHYKFNTLLRRVSLTFVPGPKKQSGHCSETYLTASVQNYNIITVKDKPHTIHFTLATQEQWDAVKYQGIYIFRTCDNFDNAFGDLLMTIELFFGGFSAHPKWGPILGSKPAPWMVRSNIEFIEKATGYRWEERPNVFVDLDEHEVGNGDFLAITRFDGLDQLIEWGTGSHSGHSAVIFEVDGELCVVESQDGWYWPKKNIQRNPWKIWKKWAQNAGFNVAVLPLSPESKAKWNQEAAEKWFKKMEGFPYGYHNFIFGWIDTPDRNFPAPLDPALATVIFSIIEKLYAAPITQLVGEGLNKRLGTEGLSVAECATLAGKRGISLGELYAIVEQDSWIYSDGPSQVCSSFGIGLYQAAGLLTNVQATEFTPKDVYQLKIYDSNYVVPAKCKVNDPDLPFCQIMGTHRFSLPGYNTIEPYEHMNEHCESMAPEYFRTPGC